MNIFLVDFTEKILDYSQMKHPVTKELTHIQSGDIIEISKLRPKAFATIIRDGIPLKITDDQISIGFNAEHFPNKGEQKGRRAAGISHFYAQFLASAIASFAGMEIEESFTFSERGHFQFRVT